MDRTNYAVITGASRGLGKAFAVEAARRGYGLILLALPGTGLPLVAESLRRRFGTELYAFETDLSRAEELSELAGWLARCELPIGLLVNNAGVGSTGTFDTATPGRVSAVVDVNVQALTQLTRLLLPTLAMQPRAQVLNVSSLAAYYPMPAMAVYAATKSYVLHFSLALREELRGTAVTVTALCPGGILTNAESVSAVHEQGWFGWISARTPEQVVKAALRGAGRGKATVVPGWPNALLRFFSTVAPKSLVVRVIGGRFSAAKPPPGRALMGSGTLT